MNSGLFIENTSQAFEPTVDHGAQIGPSNVVLKPMHLGDFLRTCCALFDTIEKVLEESHPQKQRVQPN